MIMSTVDPADMPTTGRWEWKEDTHQLFFISFNPAADRQANKKDKRHGKAAVHFPDGKRPDRGTPSIGSRAYAVGRQSRNAQPGQRAQSSKQAGHKYVTLNDIKDVAFNMMSDVEDVAPTFEALFDTDQFNKFLMCLLNYFHYYFEKKAHEEKPNPMNIEPSIREKHYYAELCASAEGAQKILGSSYSVLLLGIGLERQHHMSCGQMLRSETFNPAIRVKNAPDPESDDEKDEKEKKEEKKLTPAEMRRLQGKRPPIKSIINQRSPALVSILPSPAEESNYLFKRAGALTPTSLGQIGKETDEDDETDQLKALHLASTSNLKTGIIGEPMSHFNPITLTPLGHDNEEEDDETKAAGRRESTIASSHKTPQPQQKEPNITREVTAASAVTVEALPDDEDV